MSVRRTRELSVIGILHSAHDLRLGFAYSAATNEPRDFAVYAESALPADRRSRLSANPAFTDLHYALYLGASTSARALLVTDLGSFPVRGRRSQVRIGVGDSMLTLIVTPNGSLGGAFFQNLPPIIALVGAALTLAATLLVQRLVRGRREAEALAGTLDRVAEENRRLYAEQRGIAQTLQHALLPETLPDLPGLSASSRFVPGMSGVEVGGDWYDLTALEDGSVLLVVGDVSGQGAGSDDNGRRRCTPLGRGPAGTGHLDRDARHHALDAGAARHGNGCERGRARRHRGIHEAVGWRPPTAR